MQDFNQRISKLITELEKGNYDLGIEHLTKLNIETQLPEEKLAIAKIYISLGFIQEAKEVVNTLKKELDSLPITRLKAEIYYMEGNYDKALELMHNIIDVEQTDDNYFFISQIYFDDGLPEVAYRYIDKAIQEDDKNSYYYYHKGLYAFELAQIDDALSNFHIALDLDYDEPLYHLAIAKTLYSIGDFEGSLESCDLVLKHNPDQEEAMYLKGLQLIHTDRVSEGIPYLEKLAYMYPENLDLLINLSDAYGLNNNDTKSFDLLQTVIKMDEYNLPALKRLSEIYITKKKWIEAKEYLDKAVQLDPDDELLQLKYENLKLKKSQKL